jgi:glycerophosphoryl diester phosphodiesterase
MRRLLVAILLIAVAWYGIAWFTRVPAAAPLVIVAHRGAPVSSKAPENTLKAFRAAIEDDATVLEFDVRRTADGHLVVLHDATVDRTTDGTGAVADLTLEEVQALDAGGGERIPTVSEVIELAGESDLPIWPEIKDPELYPGIAEDLLELLDVRAYLDRARILSFDAVTLATLRDRSLDVHTCWLTGFGRFDVSSPPGDADAVCPMAEMLLLHPGMIAGAHRAGLSVHAWWGQFESGLGNDALIAFGVDGLIVDDVNPLP